MKVNDQDPVDFDMQNPPLCNVNLRIARDKPQGSVITKPLVLRYKSTCKGGKCTCPLPMSSANCTI